MIQVYEKNENCCGCGVCSAACPKQAITMEEGACGAWYPRINSEKCVDCGLCAAVCAQQKPSLNPPQGVYAGVNLDAAQKRLSTSAGIFSGIAEEFLKQGGLVYGAAMEIREGKADAAHILIDSVEDLPKLQGSKYVQSNFFNGLKAVKEALAAGKRVLISGTPCQIGGAGSLLKKYRAQVYFMDVICHGVPSLRFFNDYLADYQEKHKIRVEQYKFRDKENGWGHNGALYGTNASGKPVTKIIRPKEDPYYRLFLEGEFCRESCYQCPYACAERVSDITIGDYWGVDQFDPQLLAENGGSMSREEGISCLLVNTEQGRELLQRFGGKLHVEPVALEHIRRYNTQLNAPSQPGPLREELLALYEAGGYAAVRRKMEGIRRREKIVSKIKRMVPQNVKDTLKKLWHS